MSAATDGEQRFGAGDPHDFLGIDALLTDEERLRAKIFNFYFADAVSPVTPAELAAAHHDGTTREAIQTGPEWTGKLHGGAEERPETDAYAGHQAEQEQEQDPKQDLEHEVDPDPTTAR